MNTIKNKPLSTLVSLVMFPVLPFDPIQKSTALAIAEVIEKRNKGKKITDKPYANAFLRIFFGTTTPTRSKLLLLCHNTAMTIPEIKSELNRLIESNGWEYTALNQSFKEKAFPSLAGLDRFDAHCQLKETQQLNIESKVKNSKDELLKRFCKEILDLSPKELSTWVFETSDQLNDLEQTNLLEHWHKEKANDDLSFYDLYRDFDNAMTIAVDLSYI